MAITMKNVNMMGPPTHTRAHLPIIDSAKTVSGRKKNIVNR